MREDPRSAEWRLASGRVWFSFQVIYYYKIPAARLLGRKLVRTLCCYMIVAPFLDYLIPPATIFDILL